MIPNLTTKCCTTAAILFVAALAAGCAGSTPSVQEQVDEEPWEVTVVSMGDTVTVEGAGETWDATDGDKPQAPPGLESTPAAPGQTAPDPEPEAINPSVYTFGYRIQIVAAGSLLLAERDAAEADSLFSWPVHVEYESPYYKVRIGDFISREDAETAWVIIKAHYDKAWVAETMVLRPDKRGRPEAAR